MRGGQLQLTEGFFCPCLHPTRPPGRRCLCCSKLSLCCISRGTEWLFVPLADKASANSHLSRVHTHKHGHAAGGVANDVIPTLEPKLTNRLTDSWGADELISYANRALCLSGHTFQFHLLASDSIKEDSSVFNLSYSLGFRSASECCICILWLSAGLITWSVKGLRPNTSQEHLSCFTRLKNHPGGQRMTLQEDSFSK